MASLRLMTTRFTKITRTDNDPDFENARLCDNMINGTILGFNEINIYKSCEQHWNKLDGDQECPICEKAPVKSKYDFNTDLYIQNQDTNDIQSFLIFRRQAAQLITLAENDEDESEDSIGLKLNELEGKSCIVEFDDQSDDNKPIIPKRIKLCTVNK